MHKVCTYTTPTYFTLPEGLATTHCCQKLSSKNVKNFAFYGAKSDVVDASGLIINALSIPSHKILQS